MNQMTCDIAQRFTKWTLASLVLMTNSVYAQESVVQISQFDGPSETAPSPWKVVRLSKSVAPTQYRIIAWDGVLAVEANANRSMALFARQITVNLQATPILCWRWRIDAPLLAADMKTKAGDDYAARVYVALSLPPSALYWGTKMKLGVARSIYGDLVPDAALNYVWDNRYPVGTLQPNAYTDRTQMIVTQSGKSNAGKWVTQRRDVLADAISAFGDHRYTTNLIAVAADTDNTGESARSGFADLHFVERSANCHFE